MRFRAVDLISVQRFGKFGRIAALACVILQLVLPGAFTVADGWFASAGSVQADAVHVEDFGHKGDPRIHHEDQCVVCQFAAHNIATAAKPPNWIGSLNDGRTKLVVARLERVISIRSTGVLARAPPIV